MRKLHSSKLNLIYVAVFSAFALSHAPMVMAQTKPVVQDSAAAMNPQMHQLAASYYEKDVPGATVIVTKQGKTIFRAAYGLADAQTKRALQPDDLMRIGSITKQFTAVAILILVDEGKISLDDSVQKFFPDYPESGKKITIEHLLTHTSGIVSYTSKPSFQSGMDKHISVSDMIASFQNDALEFEPGSRYNYSNSGYFLLGAIIEKVSGLSYAKFVEQRLFSPLGMKHTAYEGHEVQPQREAMGHMRKRNEFLAAKPISMSQPYAAGALRSNVDDLALWDKAVRSGQFLKPETWKRALSTYTLKNGMPTNYGYGWGLGQLEGSQMFSHGGGINGFSTYALHLPQEQVYVAVLTNSDSGLARPDALASRLASIAIGKPIPDFQAIKLDEKALDKFVGVYTIDDKNRRYFVREGDKLVMSRTNGPRTVLQAYAPNQFFVDRESLLRVEFVNDAQGEVREAKVFQNGTMASHFKTQEALPAKPAYIKLPTEVFDRYVGEYQIAPNFILSVRRDGDRYITQATGQGEVMLEAISTTLFDAPAVPAQLRFDTDSEGKVSQVVLKQGGREIPAKRLP